MFGPIMFPPLSREKPKAKSLLLARKSMHTGFREAPSADHRLCHAILPNIATGADFR